MAERQAMNLIRRPILFSVADSEQLAVESSRAGVIQQQIRTDKSLARDFTAYFHSSTNNSYPDSVFTSHHSLEPQPRRRTVNSIYPCLRSLRWNPYVETSSVGEDTGMSDQRPYPLRDLRPDMRPERQEFKCRCENCAMKNCLSIPPSCSAGRAPVFKDNIMTFCDQHTMTPRLNEVGCGSTPVSLTRVSDVSVTACDKVIKDTQANLQNHQIYSHEKCPTSILKTIQEGCASYSESQYCKQAHHTPINYYEEPERDIGEVMNTAPSKSSFIKSFFRCRGKKNCNDDIPRRILYNEGISDSIANHFPITPVKVPSPINLKKECSKVSVRSNTCSPDEGIPFSHRSDSKYHHNCKKPKYYRSFYGDMDDIKQLATPNIVRKMYANKPKKCYIPPIRMPKRVLTSERDIELYVDKRYPQFCKEAKRISSRNKMVDHGVV